MSPVMGGWVLQYSASQCATNRSVSCSWIRILWTARDVRTRDTIFAVSLQAQVYVVRQHHTSSAKMMAIEKQLALFSNCIL